MGTLSTPALTVPQQYAAVRWGRQVWREAQRKAPLPVNTAKRDWLVGETSLGVTPTLNRLLDAIPGLKKVVASPTGLETVCTIERERRIDAA